jgi:DNA-binding transcriptional LysR family regulator
LRIDIGSSTASEVLIPALPEFLERYPEIKIDLGVSDRSVDLISANVDCVIRGGALAESSLVAKSIGQTDMVTCASPAYLKRHGIPAYPEELKSGHRLIAYVSTAAGRAVPFRFECEGGKSELKIEHYIGINESNAHVAAGEAGLGIIQTFAYCTRQARESGMLVEILQQWRPPKFPFHVVYPQNRHLTHRLRVFIDWLAATFPARLN